MGTTMLEWQDVSDSLEAEMTMDGVTRSKNDKPKFQFNYIPIPIIHVDYEINTRSLNASRNNGNGLDVTMAEHASRKCSETLENLLFTNVKYSFGEKDSRNRNTIYSYLNHPDRNPVTLTLDWDASGKTGEDILKDVQNMKAAALAKKKYGPYMLYIPSGYETIIDNDYSSAQTGTTNTITVRERILKLNNIKGIKVVDTLPANNVLLVQMTTDTVRLIQGFGIQNVQWETEGKMLNKFKVMTIQVPQIRSDIDGNCGIVHLA